MNENHLNQAFAIDDLASEHDREMISTAMPELYKTLINSIRLNKTGHQPFNESNRHKVLVAKNKALTSILGYLIAEITDEAATENATLIDKIKIAKIIHIWVKPIWRQLHIAKSLINKLERDCQAGGIIKLTLIFDFTNEAMHALTKTDNGWCDPEYLNGYTFSSRSKMLPLLKDLKHAIKRLQIKAVTSTLEKDNFQKLIDCSQSDAQIPPWARLNLGTLQSASPEYSRIFYEDQEIVGWLITFPLANETLDYRILWLDGSHRNTGIALKALTEIMHLAHFQDPRGTKNQTKDHGYPWPKGFFVVHSENQAMENFAKKRLAPASNEQKRLVYREKSLIPVSGQSRTEPWR